MFFDDSMKTFNEIEIKENKLFYGHTSEGREPEKLEEHFRRTLESSKQICEDQNLNEIIRTLLHEIFGENVNVSIFEELLKKIIYYHDIGKINPKFQKKLGNHLNNQVLSLSSDHALYGQKIFEYFYFENFRQKLKDQNEDSRVIRFGRAFFFIFTSIIGRHHLYIKNAMFEDDSTFDQIDQLGKFGLNWGKVSKEELFTNKCDGRLKENMGEIRYEKGIYVFYLYKLAYSLTVMSDYYATSEYNEETKWKSEAIGEEFIKKIERAFYEYCYNKKLKDKSYVEGLLKRDAKSFRVDEINEMRTRMLLESDDVLKKKLKDADGEKIFYLKMPTGGGKTNTSLKLVLSILSKNPNLKRVFYVFPFINLIKQNYDFIKKVFDIDKEISAVYSMSEWDLNASKESEEIEYVLNQEFMNCPFVVISNVNFFNTFIKNKKNVNLRFVNFANSIVVLDEIQSLSDKDWKVFSEFIKWSSKVLNIYYVIMSATLPNILSLSDCKCEDLIKKENSRVFFDNFYKRTEIVKKFHIDSPQKLREELLKEIKDKEHEKILIVLNTVRDSKKVFQELKDEDCLKNFGFDVCLLNSTFLNVHRAEKIEKFKKGAKIILVSTQCVEAGLDLDADFGIRDACILDSIEQVAGRVNRNFKKDKSKVFISRFKNENTTSFEKIYGKTKRYQESKKVLESVYERNCIGDYYENVIKNLKETSEFQKSADTYVDYCRNLKFEKLNELDVICEQTSSFIVDVEITVSEEESKFLKSVGLNKDKSFSGKEVFEKFQEFKSLKNSFYKGKIGNKKWSSILSKFSISLRPHQINKDSGIIDGKYYCKETGLDLEGLKKSSDGEYTPIEDRLI